jgi:hypothetical protein
MAISKRTRFEVLRRDAHTCQYCGEAAPNVTLHVDHVEPVALGGSDKPSNLITACKDCNLGKTSIAPDSPFVDLLSARAAAYALGMSDRLTRLRATIEAGDAYYEQFEDAWSGYKTGGGGVPLPLDAEATLHRWSGMGVPWRVVELGVQRAMALRNPQGEHGRFRYLCGIVWRQFNDSDIDYTLTSGTAVVYTEWEHDNLMTDYGYEAFHRGRAFEAQQRDGAAA